MKAFLVLGLCAIVGATTAAVIKKTDNLVLMNDYFVYEEGMNEGYAAGYEEGASSGYEEGYHAALKQFTCE